MSDSSANLVLEHLRSIHDDLSAIRIDVSELKDLVASVESDVAGLRRDVANLSGSMARSAAASRTPRRDFAHPSPRGARKTVPTNPKM